MSSAIENEISEILCDGKRLVRAIFSGRRRNMQPEYEKIEFRPVQLNDQLHLQVVTRKDDQTRTSNIKFGAFPINEVFNSGYANCLVEATDLTLTARFTKNGTLQVHRDYRNLKQNTAHDRFKSRLLEPDSELLKRIGISSQKGLIKPSMNRKYMQIEEFLRILTPILRDEIASGRIQNPTENSPLRLVDHGCGNAYLTFAVHDYLSRNGLFNRVIGIDQREESRSRNEKIAVDLGLAKSFEFRAEKIATSKSENVDVAIALHACDTATDDALAWSIRNQAKIVLVSPCCHHQLQTQMLETPEPWPIITRHGILKERLGDILTDSLRSQVLKMHGYRSEIIEFIGDEHTPRNLMIRAVLTGTVSNTQDLTRFREILEMWSIRPKLAEILALI